MSIAFYSGIAGMKSFQERLNVTGNNMANVGTYGYKKQTASFSDLMYTRMNTHKNYPETPAGAAANTDVNAISGGPNADLIGHGVKIGSTEVMYGQAGFVSTDMPLDFAIEGDGLFAVEKDGKREYTRNGAFDISLDGNKAYLVTNDNARVLDANGRPITLEIKNNLPVVAGLDKRLGVYNFSNPFGLSPANGSCFRETAVSGKGVAQKANSTQNVVRQYTLENSSVDLGEEMVEMMTAQRAFQLNSKMVQTADQIDEMVNNLR